MSSNKFSKKETSVKNLKAARVKYNEKQLQESQSHEDQEGFIDETAENIYDTICDKFDTSEVFIKSKEEIEREIKLIAEESKVTLEEATLNSEGIRELYRMHLRIDQRETFSKCCEKFGGSEYFMKRMKVISELLKVNFDNIDLEDKSKDDESEE
jgi:hypothetical protein